MPSFKCERQPSFCMKSKVQFTHREGNTKALRNVMYLGTCRPFAVGSRRPVPARAGRGHRAYWVLMLALNSPSRIAARVASDGRSSRVRVTPMIRAVHGN